MIIELLAKIIAGTQVPRSLGKHVLGTATEPWDKLRTQLHLHGWNTEKEIEDALRKVLVEQ